MEENIEAMDRLKVQFGSLRVRRNIMLVQRQNISVLDTELSSLELQLSFLSGMIHSYDFYQKHTKVQDRIEKTAKTWFGESPIE